jgi:hypothetical protein
MLEQSRREGIGATIRQNFYVVKLAPLGGTASIVRIAKAVRLMQ